jgi:hypothetical protein
VSHRWVNSTLAVLLGISIGLGVLYVWVPEAAEHSQQSIANYNPDPNPQGNPGHK